MKIISMFLSRSKCQVVILKAGIIASRCSTNHSDHSEIIICCQSVMCNRIISMSTGSRFRVLYHDQSDHHANSMAFIVVVKGAWSSHQGVTLPLWWRISSLEVGMGVWVVWIYAGLHAVHTCILVLFHNLPLVYRRHSAQTTWTQWWEFLHYSQDVQTWSVLYTTWVLKETLPSENQKQKIQMFRW